MISKRNFILGAGLLGAGWMVNPLLGKADQNSVVLRNIANGSSDSAFSRAPFATAEPLAARLIAAAEKQVGKTVQYDGAYVKLSYPMGDIPLETGVCTDVIIRAFRDAFDIDLQRLVHEDMKTAFAKYPKIWGLKRPDKNIDHRRVPNLERYFHRKRAGLNISNNGRDYLPGDLVSQRLPGNLPHIAIVSNKASRDEERPLLIHNIGAGTQIEDRLFEFKISGHFRFFPKNV